MHRLTQIKAVDSVFVKHVHQIIGVCIFVVIHAVRHFIVIFIELGRLLNIEKIYSLLIHFFAEERNILGDRSHIFSFGIKHQIAVFENNNIIRTAYHLHSYCFVKACIKLNKFYSQGKKLRGVIIHLIFNRFYCRFDRRHKRSIRFLRFAFGRRSAFFFRNKFISAVLIILRKRKILCPVRGFRACFLRICRSAIIGGNILPQNCRANKSFANGDKKCEYYKRKQNSENFFISQFNFFHSCLLLLKVKVNKRIIRSLYHK